MSAGSVLAGGKFRRVANEKEARHRRASSDHMAIVRSERALDADPAGYRVSARCTFRIALIILDFTANYEATNRIPNDIGGNAPKIAITGGRM